MTLVVLAELWGAYGVLARVPAEVVTNVPNGALCLAVVVLVAWRRQTLRASMLTVVALSATVFLFALICAAENKQGAEALVAVVASLGLCVPQLWKSLSATDLAGLSALSWALNTVAATSWMVYGLAIAKLPVYLPCAVTIPMSLIIATRAREGSSSAPGTGRRQLTRP